MTNDWSASLRARFAGLYADEDSQRCMFDAAILLLSLAVLSAIFWREASGAVTVWIEFPTFNHCFLILPISLFIMWTRRDGLSSFPQQPRLLAAILLVPLSLLWLATSIASILEAQQLVAVTILQVTLLATLGWPVYRRFMAAFLYLYFLVPAGAELVPALQQLTAHLAVAGLKLIGIPVYSNGAVIEIPAGTFAVAEACAGLRFLVATIAFGVFYATQIYTSIIRRLTFIALCVVVPIIANGMRVFGIIAAAQWLGSPTAAVADHLIYGWGFFSLVLVVLVFAGRRFADYEDAASVQDPASLSARLRIWPVLGAALLCASLAASFPVLSAFLGASSGDALPASAPSISKDWRSVADDSDWKPVLTAPSRELFAAYSDGQDTVYSFLALYSDRGRTNNLVRSNNRIAEEGVWKLNATSRRTIQIDGHDIQVNETTIAGPGRLTVWSFYVVGGRVETSVWTVKLRQLENYFSSERCTSAFVAIAAASAGDQPANSEIAGRYLSAVEPLRDYLCAGPRGR